MADSSFIKLCSVSDIAEADAKCFEVEDISVLVCHTNKGFYAVENKCSHQTAELMGGKIRSCFIFCPLHGQRFDLRDGSPIGKLTDRPIRTFALKIKGDEVRVNPALVAAQD